MDVGLNIIDNLRISIGMNIDKIEQSLKKESIKYSIPYSSNSEGTSNMIMFIEKYGVELNTINGIVSFIKSNNNKLNYVCDAENTASDTLISVRNHISNNFNVPINHIRLDRFETNSFKSVLSIPYKLTSKVKITLIMGVDRKIYIESMELVAM